jgi:hypothetical protein
MYCIEEMMREWHYEEPIGNKTILPAMIKPKTSFGLTLYCSSLPFVLVGTSKEAYPECFADATT